MQADSRPDRRCNSSRLAFRWPHRARERFPRDRRPPIVEEAIVEEAVVEEAVAEEAVAEEAVAEEATPRRSSGLWWALAIVAIVAAIAAAAWFLWTPEGLQLGDRSGEIQAPNPPVVFKQTPARSTPAVQPAEALPGTLDDSAGSADASQATDGTLFIELEGGVHNITIVATDEAGNVGTASIVFTVDASGGGKGKGKGGGGSTVNTTYVGIAIISAGAGGAATAVVFNRRG